MDKRPVYIYALTEPDGSRVRYVGKAVKLQRRYRDHLAYSRAHRNECIHCERWIRKILKEGQTPGIIVIECCDEKTWEERERYWIAHFSNLTNIQIGGGGGPAFRGYRSSPKAQGENNPKAKLTEADVIEIRRLWATENGTQKELAERFNISQRMIGRVVRHEAWNCVPGEKIKKSMKGIPRPWFQGEYHANSKLTATDIIEIRQLYATGMWTQYILAECFGVSQTTIYKILRHYRWSSVPGEKIVGACLGLKRWNAKLTDADVIKIRRFYTTGKWLQRELAEQFNVTQRTISKIVRREARKHT